MEDIKVRVAGAHKAEDGSAEVIETKAVGRYHNHKNKHFLVFDELTEDREIIHSRAVYDNGKLSVVRRGAVTAEMNFEEGKLTPMRYETPAGLLEFTIKTKKVRAVIRDDFIELEADYEIRSGEETLQKSSITITASEA